MTESDAAYQKLIGARSILLLQHPFFATLALRLRLQEDRSCRSVWTDGECFAYNPGYIHALSKEKLLGLTAHVVMHPACGHHLRRHGRDFQRWNEACDYAINWILEDAGFSLPDSFMQKDEYREMSAEAIYDRLCGDSSEEQRADDEENSQEVGSEQENDQEEEKKEEESESDAAGQEGSDGLPGEVRDAPRQQMESHQNGDNALWEEALLSAASQAKEMGKMPEGIARLIERRLYPELPWAELLARFVERNARSDYTWMMPNRRYLHQNLFFPALLDSELQQIVVAVDTSGSIQDEQLQRFAAEISAIMDQLPSCLHLLYCDASVQKYQRVEKADLPITLEPEGGGGTDFRPVFEKIEQEQINAACLIYLTDLECLHYPPESPSYPVLWVQTGGVRTRPPFGEVIMMRGTDENYLEN